MQQPRNAAHCLENGGQDERLDRPFELASPWARRELMEDRSSQESGQRKDENLRDWLVEPLGHLGPPHTHGRHWRMLAGPPRASGRAEIGQRSAAFARGESGPAATVRVALPDPGLIAEWVVPSPFSRAEFDSPPEQDVTPPG